MDDVNEASPLRSMQCDFVANISDRTEPREVTQPAPEQQGSCFSKKDMHHSTDSYTCGGCGTLFRIVCQLHKHLQGQNVDGTYTYIHSIQTAYPTYDTVCRGTQTEQDSSERIFDNIKTLSESELNETVETKQHNDTWSEDELYAENKCDSIHDTPGRVPLQTENTHGIDDDCSADIMDEFIENAHKNKTHIKAKSEGLIDVPLRQHKRKSKRLSSKSQQKFSQNGNHQKDVERDHEEQCETSVKCMSKATVNRLKKDYSCDICGKGYKVKSSLAQHRVKIHSIKESKLQKTLCCKWCGEKFEKKKCLLEHKRHCDKDVGFKCFICDTDYTSKEELNKHLVIHRNESDLTCSLCMRQFPDEISMQYHARDHKLPKTIECDRCGKTFHQYNRLKAHLVICNDERSFECQQCELKFKTGEALRHHSSIHKDDRPYMCHICGYSGTKQFYCILLLFKS